MLSSFTQVSVSAPIKVGLFKKNPSNTNVSWRGERVWPHSWWSVLWVMCELFFQTFPSTSSLQILQKTQEKNGHDTSSNITHNPGLSQTHIQGARLECSQTNISFPIQKNSMMMMIIIHFICFYRCSKTLQRYKYGIWRLGGVRAVWWIWVVSYKGRGQCPAYALFFVTSCWPACASNDIIMCFGPHL